MNKRFHLYFLALLPFLILLSLYEIAPLITIIAKSFYNTNGTGLSLEQYRIIFTKAIYQRSIINSLKISIFSAVVGIVVSFFGAKAIHGVGVGSKLKNFFTLILNVTSNFSGVPLAFSFMLLLGNSGVMITIAKQLDIGVMSNFNLYSIKGLMLVYIYFQIPLATLLMVPAFNAVRKEWIDVAATLKAGPLYFWFKVGIPVLLPSLLGTFSTLFANALAGYATAYALIASNYALLPINIAGMFTGDIVARKELGSALSVIVMLLMLISTFLNNYIVKKTCSYGGGGK